MTQILQNNWNIAWVPCNALEDFKSWRVHLKCYFNLGLKRESTWPRCGSLSAINARPPHSWLWSPSSPCPDPFQHSHQEKGRAALISLTYESMADQSNTMHSEQLKMSVHTSTPPKCLLFSAGIDTPQSRPEPFLHTTTVRLSASILKDCWLVFGMLWSVTNILGIS